MKPQLQTRPHPNGDCIRACLATLLELPIEVVPDFTEIPDKPDAEPDAYPEWYIALQTWVRQFGFAFVEIQLDEKTWMPLPHEMFAIFVGPTDNGVRHAIVGRCVDGGFYPAFDPLGRDMAEGQSPLAKIEGVCLLVQVDPMQVMRMGLALETIEKYADGIVNKIVADAIRTTAREALGKRAYDGPRIVGLDGKPVPENQVGK